MKETVRKFANCAIQRLSRPGRQGKIKMRHPLQRFQVVAMDIIELSPPSAAGSKKIIFIGDLLPRYISAIPAKDERAVTVARAILDHCILRYGPPERLLTDKAKVSMGKVVTSMCEQLGVHEVFTSPYHPQTDGLIERFKRTLLRDLRAYVSANEDDWDLHIAMA